jgi:choline dehydrogenase-like flavoprotein
MEMRIEHLSDVASDRPIESDVVIIGSGPAGLTVARELAGSKIRVLILESGVLSEQPAYTSLNAVESIGEPSGESARRRVRSHGPLSPSWSAQAQPYGVRCRVFGGASHAWTGKCAAFDAMDFMSRDWVPLSGWPFGLETLQAYIDRAAVAMNLGPNLYDERLWDPLGVASPSPPLNPDLLRSFFWQFARSPLDRLDFYRFGPMFLQTDASNVRILLDATVLRLDTDDAGRRVQSLEVAAVGGARANVRGRAFVLAASGIENPRLLLLSNRVHPEGLGNRHGNVGRYLMDHPTTRLGGFGVEDIPAVLARFGLFGLRRGERTHMYQHGLIPSHALQRRERLLNCAAFMSEERAMDDPWDALKRLLRGRSRGVTSDMRAVVANSGLIAQALGARMRARVRRRPIRSLPHKYSGLHIDGITEQRPDPDSRITLSDRRDALGLPMARIDWRIDDDARRSLIRLGHLLRQELPRAGLPKPVLEPWIEQQRPQESVLTDHGHSMGTTRMSSDPRHGVVDDNCQVHDVQRLYVAGGSVFPTGGHANPTLMIVALAIRLADRIRFDLESEDAAA